MTFKRLLPVLVMVALFGAALALRLDRNLTLDALRDNRTTLFAFVAANRLLAAISFVIACAAVVALSLPGATIMTLAGGFLFGAALAASLTGVGATIGAAVLFLIARSAFGDVLRQRAGPFLSRMAEGFQKNSFSYLLFLRLVPALPFWAVNLPPAPLGMRLVPLVAATAIGIISGTTLYSAFGASLGGVLDAGSEADLKSVFTPTLIAALVGLGVLSLLPVVLRRSRKAGQ